MQNIPKNNRELGRMGEDLAAQKLREEGYQIVERNYHSRYGEIDLIAQKEEILAFVEVKTRTEGSLGTPEEAVTPAKQRRIVSTAQDYLMVHPSGCQPRFDVCTVLVTAQDIKITFFENAF